MANFSMTCTCGDTMAVEAASRDEAVGKLQTIMTQEALDQHFSAKHSASEPKPSLEQAHAMIGETVAAA